MLLPISTATILTRAKSSSSSPLTGLPASIFVLHILLFARHLECSFSNVHHITLLPCSRHSHGSLLTLKKGKLLTIPYCPLNIISCLSPLSPHSLHAATDCLALPQTCLSTTYLRAFVPADLENPSSQTLPLLHSGLKHHILREALPASTSSPYFALFFFRALLTI